MKTVEGENMLTSEQKIGFVLLLIFGILSVGLGFLQLRNTVYNPYAIKKNETASHIVQFEDEATRLQKIDTDQDGINDYKELEFYKTSPYLADTDSDGKTDKEEIDAGTDPLCPEGSTCGALLPDETSILTDELTTKVEKNLEIGNINSVLHADGGNQILNVLEETNPEIAALLSDPKKIRELLIASGNLSEEEVNAFSDEELYQKIGEVLLSQQKASTQEE